MAPSVGIQQEVSVQYEPIGTERQHSSRFTRMDWFFLLQIASINIGSHYNQHCLSSLSTQIMEVLRVNRTEYGMLFSSEEIPGIVIAFVSGMILVYVPHAPTAVLLAAVVTTSGAMGALAVTYDSYRLLLVGRFLLGLTQGALTTVQGAIIANRFSTHVGTGFGMMLLSSRLSSFAGLTLPAFFSVRFGLAASMWISALFTLPSLISVMIYATMPSHLNSNPSHRTRSAMPLQVIRSLPRSFWVICYLWCVVSGVVYTFLHFAPDAVSSRWNMSPTTSSAISSSLMTVAALSSPVLGVIQDRIHYRATVIATCCFLLFLGTLLMMTSLHYTLQPEVPVSVTIPAIAGLTMFALGFSGAPVTLMGCIALTVEDGFMSAALGIYKASEMTVLAILHSSIGALRDMTGTYLTPLFILAILALSGIVAAVELSKDMKHVDLRCDEPQSVTARDVQL